MKKVFACLLLVSLLLTLVGCASSQGNEQPSTNMNANNATPTTVPISDSTAKPTTTPTTENTTAPTTQSTTVPTTQPTSDPTPQITTTVPTTTPTTKPTTKPTTVTTKPTVQPNPTSDFEYHALESRQLIIIDEYVGESKNVVVPAFVDGLPVYCINVGAFATLPIESAVLPNTVEIILHRAFDGCENLKTIQFSSNLKRIDSEAFRNCTNLKKVVLPNGLNEIGTNAFLNCTALQEVIIPGAVKTFGEGIFVSCNSIETVTFENGMEVLGCWSMFTSDKIKTLVIPSSVKEIKDGTFEFLKLDSITFLGDAPTVGKDAFISCPSNFTIYYNPSASGWNSTPLNQYNLVAQQ